jgi:hypothetical protein
MEENSILESIINIYGKKIIREYKCLLSSEIKNNSLLLNISKKIKPLKNNSKDGNYTTPSSNSNAWESNSWNIPNNQ